MLQGYGAGRDWATVGPPLPVTGVVYCSFFIMSTRRFSGLCSYCSLGTETFQVLETETFQVLETETFQVLETETFQVLETWKVCLSKQQ